jgi:hypothetical protein
VGPALIWAAVALVGGALLTLERRCLGQMALVQPLVLCSVAGLLSGQPDTGIWIGACLQLFGHGTEQDADWPLAGAAAGLALLCSHDLGATIRPGDPGALIAIAICLVSALGARAFERRQSRRDGEALRREPPWDAERPIAAMERWVRARVLRGLVQGGIATLLAGGLAVLGALAMGDWAGGGEAWRTLVRIAVPAVAAAVAIGSLADFRYVALSGLTLALVAIPGGWS